MGQHQAGATPRRPPITYRLQVRGPVPASLADQLDGFTVQVGPTTTLTGPITDAADLYGLIARLECLGLTLLSVQPFTSSTTLKWAAPAITHPARSTTMTDTARDDIAPITLSDHSRLLIASHRAMRADSRRLITATHNLQHRRPSDAHALGQAFAEIVTLIHDHHWSEDDVMYPFLATRLPTFQHDAVQLERDHVNLDAAMARVTAGLRLLARTATPTIQYDTQQRLHDDARAFNDTLTDHLDREEAIIVPSFESTISPAEQRTLEAAESKLSTYRHIRMAVPWVLANTTTTDDATELRRTAPRLIGVIHDHLWERRFQRVMAPLYRPDPPTTPTNRPPSAPAA